MSTSTLTPTFRALVADVAARAKEKLPQTINGRLEGAIKLVLAHDVEPQADGTILVGSCTDPLKTYRLQGAACECKDFTDGKAPDGWCRHRIAAGIMKRVQEELPPVPAPVEPWADNDPEPAPAPAPQPLPEAPASCNVYVLIGGHKVQVTLRDTDEHRMLVRLEELLQRYPLPQPQPQPQPLAPAPSPAADATPQCPTHSAAKPSTKGQGWYCPHKRDDGTWCPWKSK